MVKIKIKSRITKNKQLSLQKKCKCGIPPSLYDDTSQSYVLDEYSQHIIMISNVMYCVDLAGRFA